MVAAYKTIKIGNPLEEGVLMGPLHSKNGVKLYQDSLKVMEQQGGKIIYGGKLLEGEGNYVEPTIVESNPDAPYL